MKRYFGLAAALAMGLASLGCGDDLGPRDWEASVDTVTLYSLARPELQGLPSAFDFVSAGGRTVVVEALGASGNWDVALSEADGAFVVLPPGAIPGMPGTSSGIGVVTDETFEALARAPSDSAFFTEDASLPLAPGRVYVIRSHPNPNFSACVHYAKMELVEADPVEGRARLRFTRNPRCNDRALVPPGS